MRSAVRDPFRQELVAAITSAVDGLSIDDLRYGYDALGRPVSRNADAFGYNARSEVVFSRRAVESAEDSYSYDNIGNLQAYCSSTETNTYTANCLNQYAAISELCASASLCSLQYDADGNLISDGTFSYTYDAENRLESAYPALPSTGALAVDNRYDHRHRRVQKTVRRHNGITWETAETHTFIWDGNNIVLENVEFADGTTRTFEYFWGADKSGTEHGAGGVEGLLAVSIDGNFYIPCYDHNGNIILYVSETGSIAAQYTYAPYGNIIDSSGSLADAFSIGFSTKPLDRETGLVAYQRRFYRPDLGRWLNRDPIEEEGGENLYAFCENNPILYIDILGESFWGYFSDGVKMLAGTLSFIAGAKLTFGTGGFGGIMGGAALMAYGMDQIHNAYENMKSRYQRRALPPGTFIQQTYRDLSYSLMGYHGSSLETALDYSYKTFEVVAVCATGWASATRSASVIRQVKPLQTVGHWTATATRVQMIRYEFTIEGGVSGVTAAGVVVVESFNVSINVIGILPSPDVDIVENSDIPILD